MTFITETSRSWDPPEEWESKEEQFIPIHPYMMGEAIRMRIPFVVTLTMTGTGPDGVRHNKWWRVVGNPHCWVNDGCGGHKTWYTRTSWGRIPEGGVAAIFPGSGQGKIQLCADVRVEGDRGYLSPNGFRQVSDGDDNDNWIPNVHVWREDLMKAVGKKFKKGYVIREEPFGIAKTRHELVGAYASHPRWGPLESADLDEIVPKNFITKLEPEPGEEFIPTETSLDALRERFAAKEG